MSISATPTFSAGGALPDCFCGAVAHPAASARQQRSEQMGIEDMEIEMESFMR
jgi:hypothetical protein